MKRSMVKKLAIGSAVAAMSLGAVACDDIEAGDDGLDPGMEGGDDMGDDMGGEDL